MKCEDCREQLSARLDDEDVAPELEWAAATHRENCPECVRWYDQAALITRLARITTAVAGPDVSTKVLLRVPNRRDSRYGTLRWALGIVGIVQGALAVGAEPYEIAAWNLALGLTFGAVALRPRRATGLLFFLALFVTIVTVGYLSGALVADLAPGRIVAHLLTAAGLVIMALLQRIRPTAPDPAASGAAARRVAHTISEAAEAILPGRTADPFRRPDRRDTTA